MAKKLKNLENKLGSWTDQAALTRTQQDETALPATPIQPARAAYPVARSLMERIASVATQYGLSQQQVVGHLLTWALDQIESGAYSLSDIADAEPPTSD